MLQDALRNLVEARKSVLRAEAQQRASSQEWESAHAAWKAAYDLYQVAASAVTPDSPGSVKFYITARDSFRAAEAAFDSARTSEARSDVDSAQRAYWQARAELEQAITLDTEV